MSPLRPPADLVAVGNRWDRADALAASDRTAAILSMLGSLSVAVGRDEHLPMRSFGDEVIEGEVRTVRHDVDGPGLVLVTHEPAVTPSRSILHVRVERHPRVKDMTLSIRYDRLISPDPVARDVIGSVAEALRRYERMLDRHGRGCHREASTTLNEIMRLLVLQCEMHWSRKGSIPMTILNLCCPTPWSGTTTSMGDPDGRKDARFLSEEARRIVEDLLPTAMAVDWIDEQDKGTGRVRSRLSVSPLGTVGMSSPLSKRDPMSDLRCLERLRLPEGAILDPI